MAKTLRIDELENYGDSKKKIPQYMNPGRAKYIRQIHGPEVYPFGRHSFDKLVRDAGALLEISGMKVVDTEKLDAFLDANFSVESTLR